MNTLQAMGTAICMTMIATAIFSLLITNRSMERVMRFALSLFFLSVLLSPVLTLEVEELLDFSVDETALLQEQQRMEDHLLSLADTQLQTQAEAMLQAAGIDYQKVEVAIHNNGETGITISELVVWINDANFTAPVKQTLEGYFGVSPEVKMEE